MGQNDLRTGLCADIVVPFMVSDSKAGVIGHANGYGSGGKGSSLQENDRCFTPEADWVLRKLYGLRVRVLRRRVVHNVCDAPR